MPQTSAKRVRNVPEPSVRNLPDVNIETYSYDLVQHCLDQAAVYNLFAVPSVEASDSPGFLPDDPDDWFGLEGGYGLDIRNSLHPFDSIVDEVSLERGVVTTPALGLAIGRFESKWFIGTDDLPWDIGKEPPAQIFDPWRGQSFAMRVCRFFLSDDRSGFSGYGIGRTYPLAPYGDLQLVCCAVGNLSDGFGKLQGFQGTFSMNGRITKEFGFIGNVSLRIIDPEGRLEKCVMESVIQLDPPSGESIIARDGATYIAMRGEKESRNVRTEYGRPPGPDLVTLVTPAIIKCVRFPLADRRGLILSRMETREQIARLTANVSLDVFAPPGTAESPNDFQTTDVYTFVDSGGGTVGTITAFVEIGKSFGLVFPSAPGQAAMRYGGFGRIVSGTGPFHGIQGTVSLNAAIGIAPHALSVFNLLRIVDPPPVFRKGLAASGIRTFRQGKPLATTPNVAATTPLPDLNKETYPFGFVQQLLDEAAHLHFYSLPTKHTIPFREGREIVGFRIEETLHRFSVCFDLDGVAGVRARNIVGERMGTFRHRWLFAPEDYAALPGREPPSTSLSPTVSQRFVMLDSELRLDNGVDGFRGFGTGRTFPTASALANQTLVGGVGTVIEGVGVFRNLEATYTYCGCFDVSHGFSGSLLIRVADPDARIRTDELIKPPENSLDINTDAKFLIFRGEKEDRKSRTEYSLWPDGEVRGITLHPKIRLVELESSLRGGQLRSSMKVGPFVGDLDALILFNPINPGAAGTNLSPIPFHDYDGYTFQDDCGQEIGRFGFDGGAGVLVGQEAPYQGEGRTFKLVLDKAPGQQALRFGGFGPIVNGRGIFENVSGLVAHNSAVGIAPHVLSSTFVARIFNCNPIIKPLLKPTQGSDMSCTEVGCEFDSLLRQLRNAAPMFLRWRNGFRANSNKITRVVVDEFNNYTRNGSCSLPRIDVRELESALQEGVQEGFDLSFFHWLRGRAKGTVIRHRHGAVEPSQSSSVYTVWDDIRRAGVSQFQRAVAASQEFCELDRLPPNRENKVDLIINEYSKDTGITSWALLCRTIKEDRAFICYKIRPDVVLWISRRFNDEGIFLFSFEWWRRSERELVEYSMLAMNFRVEFENSTISSHDDEVIEISYLCFEDNPHRTTFPKPRYPFHCARPNDNSPPDTEHFDYLVRSIDVNKPLFGAWREAFRRCSTPLAQTIATILNGQKSVDAVDTPQVSAATIARSLKLSERLEENFRVEDFDRTRGAWVGSFADYDANSGEVLASIKNFSYWLETVQTRGGFVQRVIGSENVPLPSNNLPSLANGELDYFVNFFRKDVGITGWASLYQKSSKSTSSRGFVPRQINRAEQPVIAYKIGNGNILWISQVLSDSLEVAPSHENLYFVTLEWTTDLGGDRLFCLLMFNMHIDFETCSGSLANNRFRKGCYRRQKWNKQQD